MNNTRTTSQDIIDFIQLLTVPSGTGEGQPFKLLPFQKRFIHDIYDPVDKDGNRIVRRAILSLARKNGKTMMVACLALAHLLMDRLAVKNGEIYSLGNDRDQASIVFRYCAQLVRADPELMQFIKIVDSTKTMISFKTGSVYRALSAEVGTKFGLNPTVAIVDELAQAKSRDLYDAFDSAMGAREQPLLIVISTQSNDPQHPLSILIDDGLSGRDPTTVCHLHTIPEGTENIFTDKKIWAIANPALSKFRSLSEMKTAAGRAQRMPTMEASFRNLYCNQKVNRESPLIPKAEWLACKGDATIEKGSEVYLGLDLSGKTDLTALVGISNGIHDRVMAWFWKPQETLVDHEKRDRVPYTVWKSQGFIETTPGRAIQYEWVAEKIGKIIQEYVVIGMAFDRWRIDDLMNAMSKIGIDAYIDGKDDARSGALRMVPWGQGYASMTQAVEALEISVMDRKLVHSGHPCLTWNVSNAISISDAAGNRKLDKSATRFRIDGVVAMAMAIGLKSKDMKEIEGPSVYENMDIETIKARMIFG
jgi:phage terminase large subunit-like protein